MSSMRKKPIWNAKLGQDRSQAKLNKVILAVRSSLLITLHQPTIETLDVITAGPHSGREEFPFEFSRDAHANG